MWLQASEMVKCVNINVVTCCHSGTMWLQHGLQHTSPELKLKCSVKKVECRDRHETYAKGLILPFIFDRPCCGCRCRNLVDGSYSHIIQSCHFH